VFLKTQYKRQGLCAAHLPDVFMLSSKHAWKATLDNNVIFIIH